MTHVPAFAELSFGRPATPSCGPCFNSGWRLTRIDARAAFGALGHSLPAALRFSLCSTRADPQPFYDGLGESLPTAPVFSLRSKSLHSKSLHSSCLQRSIFSLRSLRSSPLSLTRHSPPRDTNPPRDTADNAPTTQTSATHARSRPLRTPRGTFLALRVGRIARSGSGGSASLNDSAM